MSTKTVDLDSSAVSVLLSAIFAANQNFVPDVIFKGSSLTGWHKLGAADWRAENGEIIATPKRRRRLAGARQGLSGHRVLHLLPVHRRLQSGRAAAGGEDGRRRMKGIYVSLPAKGARTR